MLSICKSIITLSQILNECESINGFCTLGLSTIDAVYILCSFEVRGCTRVTQSDLSKAFMYSVHVHELQLLGLLKTSTLVVANWWLKCMARHLMLRMECPKALY